VPGPRVEVGVVGQHALPALRRHAGDALTEPADALEQDLVLVRVADQDGPQLPDGRVGLVDDQRVVGDERGHRVGDGVEQGREVRFRDQQARDVGEHTM